ncbi:MAG: PAS domain-containing protein, partial [Deferrisomatales bacterium]
MNELRVLLAETPLVRGLLDALPLAVLVLRHDLHITALNRAAETTLGADEAQVVGRLPGEALRCVTAGSCELGCGHGQACSDCLLRRSGLEALAGRRIEQREVRVRVRPGAQDEDRLFLLSAAPFEAGGRELAVVALQDVTALHRLRGLLPICAGCKKIRRGDRAWEALETFIEEHSLAEFTHGLCPDCTTRYDPEFS